MSADVIPLQLVKDRLAADERADVRAVLREFDAVRSDCPIGNRITEEGSARGLLTDPLSPAEVASVRRMLADFERVKEGCPLMKRLLSERVA